MNFFIAFCLLFKSDAAVLELNGDSFDSAINTASHAIVKFYAPWCPHCVNIAPHFEKASEALPDVLFAEVDATAAENKVLVKSHDVGGFPTLVYFQDAEPSKYAGGRTSDDIVRWLESAMAPAFLEFKSDEEVDTFTEENPGSAVVAFVSSGWGGLSAFERTARGLTKTPCAVRFLDDDDESIRVVHYVNGSAASELMHWQDLEATKKRIVMDTLPPVIALSQESLDLMPLSLVVADVDGAAFADAWAAGEEHRNTAAVLIFDANANAGAMKHLELNVEDAPAWVLLANGTKRYSCGELSMSECIQRGAVEETRMLRSAPRPTEPRDEGAEELVGQDFADFKARGVPLLVLFYAPWCPHCKEAMPGYDALAELHANAPLTVSRMDATGNEIADVDIASFPQLYLFMDDRVIEYENGPFKLHAISSWLQFMIPEYEGWNIELPEEEIEEEEEDAVKEVEVSGNGDTTNSLPPERAFAKAVGDNDGEGLTAVLAMHPELRDIFLPKLPGMSAINFASKRGAAKSVAALLEAGASPRSLHPRTNTTPLMFAVRQGASDVVELLLNADSGNVNDADDLGNTALAMCTVGGHVDIAKMLLDAGASPNTRNAAGNSPLESAAFYCKDPDMLSLLATERDEVNARGTKGVTALMLAAGNNKKRCVKALLDMGADPSLEMDNGDSAMDRAVTKGWKGIVEVLERWKGVDV